MMFEWFSKHYLNLISNYEILLGNPTHCGAVDILKLFSLTLFVVLVIKLVIHHFIFFRLKQRQTGHNFRDRFFNYNAPSA